MDFELNGLLEKIHTDALRVLEEVGVKCVSKEIRQIFEDTGLAAFDEGSGHIHVLSPLIEQVLATAPKRDQYWIPEDSFGVGGTAPFLYDDQTGELVEPTLEHLARIATIVNDADVIQFMARGVLIKKQANNNKLRTKKELRHKPAHLRHPRQKRVVVAEDQYLSLVVAEEWLLLQKKVLKEFLESLKLQK